MCSCCYSLPYPIIYSPSLSPLLWFDLFHQDGSEYSDDTWIDSDIFQSSWLAPVVSGLSDHSISEGFYASVVVPSGSPYEDWSISDTGSLNPYINGLGYFRSAWNNNPSTGICRHNYTYDVPISTTLGRPTCVTMSDCYNSSSYSEVSWVVFHLLIRR